MPAQHDLMRNTNALSIINNIRTSGATTRRAVQFATGLGWATVSTITSELIASGVLVEKDNLEKNPGRTPTLIDFPTKNNLCIGIEINIEGLHVALLDLRCNVIAEDIQPLVKAEVDSVISQMFLMIDNILNNQGLSAENLLGFGIAVQGSVDGEGKVSLYNHYIDGWRDVPLCEIIEKRYGRTAFVQHDPLSIALYEQWDKNYLHEQDIILIRLAFGIGMGYIHNKAAINGYQGTAGELGHMSVNPDGPECICGNSGCLEAYSSVRGIAKRAYKYIENKDDASDFSDNDIEKINKVFNIAINMARNGDKNMMDLFDDAGYYLGIGIANLVNILNPKIIIISGSFCEAADLFFDKAKKTAKQRSWPLSEYQIITSSSKKNAAIGAALQIINQAFSDCDSPLLK